MREHFESRKMSGELKITLPELNKVWVADKKSIAHNIKAISESYMNRGYTLTLRQLYYQLVSKDLIPNHDKVYKKIGSIKDDCVYSGLVDWDCFEDRGRVPYLPYSNHNMVHAIQQALDHFKRDRQEGQGVHIELWTEKDAISDILKRALDPYHIRLCVNKGYTSSSAIYKAYERFTRVMNEGRKVLVLYFGDHDPSGLDMIRDIETRLKFMFTEGSGINYDTAWDYCDERDLPNLEYDEYQREKLWGGDSEKTWAFDHISCFIDHNFEVKQIGLTKEQIEMYSLPPNPAKMTDPRAKKYVEEHGQISWEVDALTPEVLVELVQSHIEKVIDMDQYQNMLDLENEERKELQSIVEKYTK